MAVATNILLRGLPNSSPHIAGGRRIYPAWRPNNSRQWNQLALTSKISDLNPKNNPAINPSYPSNPNWYGITGLPGLFSAWCSMVHSDYLGKGIVAIGGGHDDYLGNEDYLIDYEQDVLTFTIGRWPSGAIGNELTINDGKELTGEYADGRPRAFHTYHKICEMGNGRIFCAVQGNNGPATTGIPRTMELSPHNHEWRYWGNHPNAGTSSGGACVYDRYRDFVWWLGVGTDKLSAWSNATNSWTSYTAGPSNLYTGYHALVVLPGGDYMVQLNSNIPTRFQVWDLNSITKTQPSVTGTEPAFIGKFGQTGAHWVPSLNAIAMWDNTSNYEKIALLRPGANPATDPWSWDLLLPEGGAIIPSAHSANGTYNRFAYSERYYGFFLYNSISENPYFFTL